MARRARRSADQKIMDRAREARRARIHMEENVSSYGSVPAWSTEGGRRDMIRVTRLSGEVLYLNILQIESMESIPETKIKMMNGYYYLVKDTAESVVEQLQAFYHSCITPDSKDK